LFRLFDNKRLRELECSHKALQQIVKRLTADNAKFRADWDEYIEWKKMRDANAETAAKIGHFYITADDSALLERLIQEVNKDPDLAVLLTTAQGTTLTLRSHPQPQVRDSLVNYSKYSEEEK
jgi:hypothetical protein